MSEVIAEQPKESPVQAKRRKAKEARDRRNKAKSSRQNKSASKPPQSVEPGWVHELIAGIGLKVAQAVAERNGIKLNVGEVDTEDLTPSVIQGEDGPQPIEVASRVVAHVAHRVPGVRRIEKKLEGKEKRSGILSDMGALAVQLYAKNQETVDDFAEKVLGQAMSGLLKPRNRPTAQPTPSEFGNPNIVDFGIAHPVGSPNNNGGMT